MKAVLDQFSTKRDRLLLQHLAFFEPMTSEVLNSKALIKKWCKSFQNHLNMNAPVNISFDIQPNPEASEDKSYSVLISKKANGVTTSLEPLHKHFFSSDSYIDLSNLALNLYGQSNFSYNDSNGGSVNNLSLSGCFDDLIKSSKKTITLQRY